MLTISFLTLINAVQAERPVDFSNNYQLKEVVVLSRHNIRSPLAGNDSSMETLTPHKWFKWTSAPSELSLRGGQLETIMGQYFRQWLVSEKLITDNYLPQEGEMRFYANSKQRTIATAKYFSSGMLPIANVNIEYKYVPESTDLAFSPRLTFMSEAFKTQALKEISTMENETNLVPAYKTLEKALDIKNSQAAKEGFNHFRTDDLKIILEQGEQPKMKGSLKLANSASDAFILQYYEEPDKRKAGFGHKLTATEWEQIGSVNSAYNKILFTAPSVAVNVAHPLLMLIQDELALPNRKFTFLCGHDSNIASVLAALEVEDYSLPQCIENKTPIGSKVVFGKWQGKDGQEYISVDLVYQTVDQLRDRTPLTLDQPPMTFPLKFKGLSPNNDGVYPYQKIKQKFQQAIDAYDELPMDLERKAA